MTPGRTDVDTFGAAAAGDAAPATIDLTTTAALTGHIERGRTTVIIVDDSDDIRLIAHSSLEIDGRFEIVGQGADGEEAVELARRFLPDVVLLDLEMPAFDGAQAVPYIRRAVPRALIAIWTVAPTTARAAAALSAGADIVLDKAEHGASLAAAVWGHHLRHRTLTLRPYERRRRPQRAHP